MRAVFLKELKVNAKQLLIWAISVGLLGFACILMYESMQGDMKEMADMFSNMGAFSDAFGMSTLSIATLKGFFATEVGTVHGLGGGMFAAILAIGIISTEEEHHTGEFLLSLPVSRKKVVMAKGACVLVMLAAFTVICAILYVIGFAALKEELPVKEFVLFMGRQFLMNLEIAGICFFISSLTGRVNMGLGLGLALVFYAFDLIGRVVPDLKDYIFLSPYSYANASEIFADSGDPAKGMITALIIIVLSVAAAFIVYDRRDLAG